MRRTAVLRVGLGSILGLAFAVGMPNLLPAQEPSFPVLKPGKEHDLLKKFVGTWDAESKMEVAPGQVITSRGVEVNRMDLGGFWMITNFKGEMGGQPFMGHGMHGYDQSRKKYINYWGDSMASYGMISEGDLDSAGKVLTLRGKAPDMTGQIVDYKLVTQFKDADTRIFTISSVKDGKDANVITVTYKKRK